MAEAAEKLDKQMDVSQTPDQRSLAWEASEFYHYERGAGWVLSVWLVGVLLTAGIVWYYGLTFFGVLSGLVPLVAALALTNQARLKPATIRVAIDQEGVHMKGQLYAWSELKSFWIVFSPDNQAIYLETTRRLLPIVSAQIGKTDPEAIRTLLLAHLPERTDRAEQFGDRLGRLIRF